jgi:hypothetical protein
LLHFPFLRRPCLKFLLLDLSVDIQEGQPVTVLTVRRQKD